MQLEKFCNILLKNFQSFKVSFYKNTAKSNAGRKPKITDEEIAAVFILSYITGMPVLKIARQFIDDSIKSYHIFRKSRIKRIYELLRIYLQMRILSVIIEVLVSNKKPRLIVDGTILPVANVNRAKTQRIKRFNGKKFWVRRKRNLYSQHYKKRVKFEEIYYGVLVMIICDTKGRVYDIWFHPASYHEVKSFRLRAKTSIWFKRLISLFEVIGDKGYRGCENVIVCETKEDKAQRQIIESVFSRLKQFNALSRWRKGITLLSYLYAYAIGYSFFRYCEV
ncbi:MAG: hypothetical protein ACK4J2_08125 [Sulfurihydrogenibium azorense]|uniref:hypothetical protein n=1 Tax=Sulfurihydrogenibium azorense TaxID=309806 RepID=UPI00391DE9B6